LNDAGCVEIWPVINKTKPEFKLPFEYDDTNVNDLAASNILANKIAQTIKEWLTTKRPLPSQNRPVKPDDILILLKKRSVFMKQLIRSLKEVGVPVSGSDRLKLQEQIAVLDLLALAEFVLLPENDLNFATLLKSPLIGLTDDDLYHLACGRKGSLYMAFNHYAESDVKLKSIRDYLDNIMDIAEYLPPYEFFAKVIYEACPANGESGKKAFVMRLGEDALDAIYEFLNACFTFERMNVILKEFRPFYEK